MRLWSGSDRLARGATRRNPLGSGEGRGAVRGHRLRRRPRPRSRRCRRHCWSSSCSPCRPSPAARCSRTCSSSSPCWRWRRCWNLLAGYAGLVSVGQQAFVGLGAYALFACTVPRRASIRCRRSCSAGLVAGVARRPDRARRVPPARRLFRHRHLGRRRGVPAVLAQVKELGGGTGTSLPPASPARCSASTGARAVRRARAGGARHRRLLAGARCSPPAPSCWSTGCCARATGWRSPPSATPSPRPRASASTRSAPSSRLRGDRRRHRHGRRAHLSAEGAHLAGRGVLGASTGRPTSSSSWSSAASARSRARSSAC